ncbi:MAG: sulfatase-like hydrolase/transferase [Armatimonadota bacterium]|nr:sulfatase-like hydrolase/transferase [Armatimonadota bacterium]
MKNKFNFLFIMTDQQRFDSLGCCANRIAHTPNIDKLASEGVRFANCYAAQALCSPSRASIISGLFPTTHRVTDNLYGIADATSCADYRLQVNWPALMHELGYKTCWIGKWHLGEKGPAYFDEWYGFNSLLSHWLGKPNKSKYRPELEADQAIDFLRRHQHTPFVLCLSHYPPHTPRTAPVEFASLYTNMPMLFQMYYGAVSAVDHHLGRVLNELDNLKLADSTVVVFTSDHGEHFGMRPGGANKRTPHDESARVPLIIRAPGLTAAGMVRHELVSNVDLMPTILELAGIDCPKNLQGTSLVPLFGNSSPPWRNSLLIQNTETEKNREPGSVNSRAVVTKDWKFILRDGLSDNARSLFELYDLKEDPFELISVYDRDKADVVHKLLIELEYWGRQLDDPKCSELAAACRSDLRL